VDVTQSFISLIERWHNIPLNDALERLREVTGLPTDAFIRAGKFHAEYPEFLESTSAPGDETLTTQETIC
jgi:hypothetical protein